MIGNLLDFGELILRSYELIKNNLELQKALSANSKKFLDDEFQDTNTIQFKWIKNLIGERANVAAVGDDDQSIMVGEARR